MIILKCETFGFIVSKAIFRLFAPEDKGTTILRNDENYSLSYTA
jgi:hypothetical protein